MRIHVSILIVAAALVACAPANESSADATAEGAAGSVAGTPHVVAASPVEAGRYLVTVGGCNDCHTDGYLATGGDVPEEQWLLGSPMGWRGPWGTSYAKNLRLTAQNVTEDGFVALVHGGAGLPPMPWMNVAQLSDQDARAIYQYLRVMGPAGEAAPAPVPPDQEPTTPYLLLEPVMPR